MGIVATVVVTVPIAIGLGGDGIRLFRTTTGCLSVIVLNYEPDHGSHGIPSGIGNGTPVALGSSLARGMSRRAGLPLPAGSMGELGLQTQLADFSLYGVLGDPDTMF
jgi:hypothetical protein